MFLSSYRNASGGLGEREMLWEHEPQASVSTAFSSSPNLQEPPEGLNRKVIERLLKVIETVSITR